MTERKIEALVHDALIVSGQLEQNLKEFRETNAGFYKIYNEMRQFVHMVEQISLNHNDIREQEIERFAREIEKQVKRYHQALEGVDIDTSQIQAQLDCYHRSISSLAEEIDRSASLIAETVRENAQEVIAAAEKIKRRKGDLLWRTVFFGMGMAIGGLFLAAYPIASAAKHFRDELLVRGKQVQQLKEQFETNDNTVRFLRTYGITIEHGVTNENWHRKSLRFMPMMTFPADRVQLIDEINGDTRVVFNKEKDD